MIIQTRMFVTENTSSSPFHGLLDVPGKVIEILRLPHGGDQYMTPNVCLHLQARGSAIVRCKALLATSFHTF